jgi:hypothetical protein
LAKGVSIAGVDRDREPLGALAVAAGESGKSETFLGEDGFAERIAAAAGQHGAEAGVLAARASFLVGFSGTATVGAEVAFGIPLHGRMEHSFVQRMVLDLRAAAPVPATRNGWPTVCALAWRRSPRARGVDFG